MTVTHAKVVGKPDVPGYDVLFSDWDAGHTVNLTASDVGADASGAAATAQAAAEAYADGLASNYAAAGVLNTATIRQAAGVPTGAPSGTELPLAFDSTPTTGGLYVWSGSAWVYAGPIPPVITPG